MAIEWFKDTAIGANLMKINSVCKFIFLFLVPGDKKGKENLISKDKFLTKEPEVLVFPPPPPEIIVEPTRPVPPPPPPRVLPEPTRPLPPPPKRPCNSNNRKVMPHGGRYYRDLSGQESQNQFLHQGDDWESEDQLLDHDDSLESEEEYFRRSDQAEVNSAKQSLTEETTGVENKTEETQEDLVKTAAENLKNLLLAKRALDSEKMINMAENEDTHKNEYLEDGRRISPKFQYVY